MTQKEREKIARSHLYRYAAYKRDVTEYLSSYIRVTSQMEETGVHGSEISDPTGRAGLAWTLMPEDLARKQRWVSAIDNAMDEIRANEDKDLAAIAGKVFGLDGKRPIKRKHRELRFRLADDMHISLSTLYRKVDMIVNIVVFHAARAELIK